MQSENPLLKAQSISVSYQILSRKFGSFKEYILSKIKGEKIKVQEFHALKGVSVDLFPGECIGLIGHNGSGKSTLLKVIAGILKAKIGNVDYSGRMTSLIELGAGFDSELPAYDNIYLSCTLMGFSRKEINENVDKIIQFAELQDFLDFPIKNYSSGMTARLGFACATAIDPDILLIDEVLAVGDERFQKKCHDRINELRKKGKGIILVSHDMSAIESFCDRVYVLNHGDLVHEGDVIQGIAKYRELMK